MRRIAVLVILALSAASSTSSITEAGAATKKAQVKQVAVKKFDLLLPIKDVEGIIALGKTLVTYSNTSGNNSNILLTGLDATGAQLWQKTIDSGADEVALTASADVAGNLWLAGASAPVVVTDTGTVQLPPDNPDGVVAEPLSKLRGDMNLLTLWKVSPVGEILAKFSLEQPSPALISAISVSASGVSLVGRIADKSFALAITTTGTFGKLVTIGTSQTQLNAVVRNADSTMSVFGTSAETLGGKKNIGIRDGILVKINKAGAITSVVRSSAPKADRSWNYSDASLALTGYVKSGKVIESAFTKFTSAFVPTWTARIPSNGVSAVVMGGALTYAALGSTSAVSGVRGWKPTTTELLLLTFDSKGVMSGAYGAPELANPLSLTYSKEIGLSGLAQASDGSLSIFRIAS